MEAVSGERLTAHRNLVSFRFGHRPHFRAETVILSAAQEKPPAPL
jgi:hypothetical protein